MKAKFSLRALIPTLVFGVLNSNTVFAAPIKPENTVKEIMTAVIEPITNNLWGLALDENVPESDEDWKAVENQAIQLLTASSALSLGGSGPKDVANAQDKKWQQYLRQMMAVGDQFLQAARTKNYQGLLDAGDVLIEPCSSCHEAFPSTEQ